MYKKSRVWFSLVIVSMSTISLSSVYIHRSSGSTPLRLSRQKGHDCDLECLQKTNQHALFHIEKEKHQIFLDAHQIAHIKTPNKNIASFRDNNKLVLGLLFLHALELSLTASNNEIRNFQI